MVKMAKIKGDKGTEIKKLINELRKYDGIKERPRGMREDLEGTKNKLVSTGKAAVPYLIDLLDQYTIACLYAADALGEIEDEEAIKPLISTLEDEDSDLGEHAKDALKKFGPVCIPEVITKVEYRIAHPIKRRTNTGLVTGYALSAIGEIRCDESIKFLNRLLDDYISEMPKESFDPSERDWKFRNVNLFHLLDCMVKQQDRRAIPHIKKARDFFPKNYTDHKVCQIAIGRIKKKMPDEGYLPLEALDIMLPSGAIMDALSGGELGWKDTFDEEYGEYFDEEYCKECGGEDEFDEDEF